MHGPTKNLGPISSAVLTLMFYWIQTNKHPNKQTDKPNLYVDDYDIICIYKAVIFVCLLVCPIQTEEPRTDLSQILIMELGRHTGMFL